VEDQALHIIGEVDKRDLGLGALEADGADEARRNDPGDHCSKPHVRFFLSEDMLDEHAHFRFDTVGLADAAGIGLPLGFLR
jgi:hypothetical protein